MKFEDVLPALRAGKKVRRASWPNKYTSYQKSGEYIVSGSPGYLAPLFEVFGDDWEVIEEPKRVADYFVRLDKILLSLPPVPIYKRVTHEIGKQPVGAVLVPGSEREETI